MIKFPKKIFSGLDEHTTEVIRTSFPSVIVRVVGMLAALFVSIFLGRTLGAEGLGVISLANKIVTLFLVVTMLGMKEVIIKRVAIGYENKNWQLVGDSIYTSSVINGLLSLTLALTGILLSSWLSNRVFDEPNLRIPLIIGLVALIPQAVSRIFGAGINGLKKIWQSTLADEILNICVVALLLGAIYLSGAEINVILVASVYAIGRLVVALVLSAYWKKLYRFKGKRNFIAGPMLKMAMPLLLVSSSSLIASSADTVMLGWLGTTREVGLYDVAFRTAIMMNFFLYVSNSALAPKIASLFADGKVAEMENMVKRVTGGLLIVAVLGLSLFIIGGKLFLSVWGLEFVEAYMVLIIIGAGLFFKVSTGSANLLLVMCGQEKVYGRIAFSFLLLNLILNFFMIKSWGIIGAALATAITVSGESITTMIFAWKRLGVLTLPFCITPTE